MGLAKALDYQRITDDKLLFKVDGRIFATQDIQELLKHVAKGRPPNKRLKSAIKINKRFNKENKNDGAKKDYICEKCNNTVHNARMCRN
ncbi:hypothetical protein C1645_828430 [Glomus cerebriforme]|uniref:Uncharacterized protein n=1 Tax=Glomus cerebriforme TaxID=658196 RepID=A0A397SLT0_9GLOM|nr:hypothetical protein C1645_828430 [Glomus cerebriforme]